MTDPSSSPRYPTPPVDDSDRTRSRTDDGAHGGGATETAKDEAASLAGAVTS